MLSRGMAVRVSEAPSVRVRTRARALKSLRENDLSCGGPTITFPTVPDCAWLSGRSLCLAVAFFSVQLMPRQQ